MKRFLVLLFLGLLILSLSAYAAKVTVNRDMSSIMSPGTSYTVTLAMDVNESDTPGVVGLTEYYPVGWSVSSISAAGTDRGGSIEWLFWSMGTPIQDRSITYTVTVPSNAVGIYDFSGTIDISTISQVGGKTQVNATTPPTPTFNVSRDLPGTVYTKNKFTVSLLVDVEELNKPSTLGLIEYYPVGWNVTSVSFGGIVKNNSRIEWLFSSLSYSVQDRNVTYLIMPPAGVNGSFAFSGTCDSGASNVSVIGDASVSPQPGCTLEGDAPPCETVAVSEVITLITNWSSGEASLSDVIRLINAWANG